MNPYICVKAFLFHSKIHGLKNLKKKNEFGRPAFAINILRARRVNKQLVKNFRLIKFHQKSAQNMSKPAAKAADGWAMLARQKTAENQNHKSRNVEIKQTESKGWDTLDSSHSDEEPQNSMPSDTKPKPVELVQQPKPLGEI